MTTGVINKKNNLIENPSRVPRCLLKRIVMVMVCAILLPGLSGCRLPWINSPAVLESGLSPSESKKYNEAVNAYLAKDYQNAVRYFAAIREQTANPVAARLALYGLACSRIMMAATPKDYREALALWETWLQCAPSKYDRENPVLFGPIIKEKMIFSLIPLHHSDGINNGQDNFRWFMYRANGELHRLKRQLETTRQGIEDRDQKIITLKKEIQRLEKQINAFEKIDQKIQNKKNAIPVAE